MASPDVATIEPGSLLKFRAELAEAGFDSEDGGRTWTGPIAEPLKTFTDVDRMVIQILDGWPFVQPQLRVNGLRNLQHANAAGTICLWRDGDPSRDWTSLPAFEQRIAEWCDGQELGFSIADATMDAHRYFENELPGLALMDLSEVGVPEDGACGPAYGRWRKGRHVLDINTSQSSGCKVKGHWFYRAVIDAPPRDLAELQELLTPEQQGKLDSSHVLAGRKKNNERLALLIWDEGGVKNVLCVLLRKGAAASGAQSKSQAITAKGDVATGVLEFAPDDVATLKRRAGSDAERLSGYRVVVFGVGAIGSHAALLLAECGVGGLTLVDNEQLRPGNVVRHVASEVGELKTDATKQCIDEHARWTTVETINEKSWSPVRLKELIGEHDLVLDATGIIGFTDQLAYLLNDGDEVLVTTALYREGRVARVSRQAAGDARLWKRQDSEQYPMIPPGTELPLQLEAGCSASVNNASPRSVVACAALTTEVVIDALTGSPQLPDEITDVYRPLEQAPFDVVGRRTSA